LDDRDTGEVGEGDRIAAADCEKYRFESAPEFTVNVTSPPAATATPVKLGTRDPNSSLMETFVVVMASNVNGSGSRCLVIVYPLLVARFWPEGNKQRIAGRIFSNTVKIPFRRLQFSDQAACFPTIRHNSLWLWMSAGILLSELKPPESTDMQKPLVMIENWAVVQRAVALSYEELQPGKHLMGKIAGHATLPDAEFIYTSPILSVNVHEGRVETRNTVYQLGKPCDDYKTWEHEHKAGAAA
jgi:hypothetical protein